MLALLSMFLARQALGQTAVGKLQGTLQREQEQPVSGALIVASNQDNGLSYWKSSDELGNFEFPDLFPGIYTFKILPDYFSVQSPRQLQIRAGDALRVVLTVARRAEAQDRAAAAGSSGASPAGAASQISQTQLTGLPLNGRSYSQLATLQGSVSDPLGGSSARGGGSGSLTVSGGRSASNSFLMDGTNIMNTGNQVPRSAGGVQLGSDTLLEVEVYGVQYGAEYGRGSGGVLNSVTRSGSDEFHATLFEFFRNSKLDARNFFDQGPEPLPFKRNQFGATATGPLRKQRTYFMGGLEVMRDRLGFTDVSNTMDDLSRRGIIFDPSGREPTRVIEVDPRVKPYIALFPPANAEIIGRGFGRNATPVFLPTNETFFTVRIDHRLSERDSLFARYNFDDATNFTTQTIAPFRTFSQSRQQYLTLVGSHIFSPQAIAAFRFGYTRPVAARDSDYPLEIPRSLYFVFDAPVFGQIRIPGSADFGPSPTLPDSDKLNSFQFASDVLWQRGRHSLKLGAEVHRYRWDIFGSTNRGGVWAFNSLESFLQAGPEATTNLSVALPGSDGAKAYRQTLVGLYTQGEFRVHPRLQLSLGLRYEFATRIHDRQGRTAFLADPLHDTQLQVGPYVDHNPSLRNVSPRVGLSWSPTGSAATVFNAGFGIFYDQMLEYVVDSRALSPPFYQSVFLLNLKASNYFPDALAAAAANRGNLQALITDYRNLGTPMVLRYNASLRQQLPGNWRVQAMYVGARGNHLYRSYEINQIPVPEVRADGTLFFPAQCPPADRPPIAGCRADAGPRNPAFGSINLLSSDAQSFYNALQLSVNKSLGRGSSAQATYTFSKSVDDISSISPGETMQYGLQRTVDRAISDFDIRHRLTLSYFYTLPFGSQGQWWKDGVLARMFGGWRLGGILSARNGTPITLKINVRREGYLLAANRPNRAPGRTGNAQHGVSPGCEGVEPGTPVGTPDQWFDPCAYSLPPAGTLGDLGRNALAGPGSFTWDVSLQREFLLDSKRRLQFRAEMFNLTNHANFRPFSASSSIVFSGASGRRNPTGGKFVDTTTTARQIQFALRLSF